MARFKPYNYNQIELIPVSFKHQILPGTFEYSLVYLIDQELDLTLFQSQYKNDYTGCPAYDPAILLKIVLLAYSRGLTSSRKIEQLCRENVLFIAISANSRPHFTTLADFISRSHEEIAKLFTQVLMVCDSQGLIGREMFAIDGCKMPSNASKEWSGTHEELHHKKEKLEQAVKYILDKHQQSDQQNHVPDLIERERKQLKKLQCASAKIKAFLESTQDKPGKTQKAIQSNITDNESAKMKSGHGVIQGYIGVAAVDSKHQIIIAADAYGQSQEHGLLEPMIQQAHQNLGSSVAELQEVKITADAGYHNADTLVSLAEQHIDGYIADPGFRGRDPRFKDYKHHKPKEKQVKAKKFGYEDFIVDLDKPSCVCPAGHEMLLKYRRARIENHELMCFHSRVADCAGCVLREKCLRKPEQKTPRQFAINLGRVEDKKTPIVEAMKQKIDSVIGRAIYSLRLGTVEPVFGHLTSAIGIKRFSLRGQKKVTGQWQLMAILHNALKLHRYGWQG